MATILTAHDVATRLGIPQVKVYRLISTGALRGIDVSLKATERPRWRVLSADFERFVQQRASTATS